MRGTAKLRQDLNRFVFLFGGNDGEPLFACDQLRQPADSLANADPGNSWSRANRWPMTKASSWGSGSWRRAPGRNTLRVGSQPKNAEFDQPIGRCWTILW